MKIAIALFDRLTVLDAVGPYEVLCRLPGAQVVFVAERAGLVRSDTGSLALHADAAFSEVAAPDIALVPGGPGQRGHMDGGPLQDWLKAADEHTRWTASVCTGSLVLAASGLLAGRRAATHWLAHSELAAQGAQPVAERVVRDGKYITAAGVSAGIDMALTLAAEAAGDSVAQRIQLAIEYDPRPPFNSGSPGSAPREVTEYLRGISRSVRQGS